MLVHSMNTGSLQSMVPKIINEAETYFRDKWQDEGVADLRQTFAELVILTASATLMGREVRPLPNHPPHLATPSSHLPHLAGARAALH